MIYIIVAMTLITNSALAINCATTTSRYQKAQCATVANFNKPKFSTLKEKAKPYSPPKFKASKTENEENEIIQSPQIMPETPKVYTPGQQYQHSAPSRYTPTPSHKQPKKTYFTPY